MALVYSKATNGPGTHALLIGIGGYPTLAKVGFSAPARSVATVFDWLIGGFHNPRTPLSSVEMLMSGPNVESDIPRPLLLASDWPVVRKALPPTARSVSVALDAWLERVGEHAENLGIVYIGGLGFQHREGPAFFLDDAAPGPSIPQHSVMLSELLVVLGRSRAAQLVVFDWHGVTPQFLERLGQSKLTAGEALPQALSVSMPGGPEGGRMADIFARSHNSTGAGYDPPPLLALALVAALHTPRADTGWVNAADIQENIAKELRRLGDRLDLPPGVSRPALSGGVSEDFLISLSREQAPALDPRLVELGRSLGEPPAPAPAPDAEETVVDRHGATLPPAAVPGAAAAPAPAGPAVPAGEAVAGPPPPAAPKPEPKPRPARKRKPKEPPAPASTPAPAPAPTPEPEDPAATEFISDEAETERDELGRGTLAVALARRLHKIWRKTNGLLADTVAPGASPAPAPDSAGGFVVHLDAPWGGGKTTFANFLARILNPYAGGARRAAAFLRERYGDADLGGLFLDNQPDPDGTEAAARLPADARRPWIVVSFNAWQAEHCAPPWWVFYQTIRKQCFDAVRVEGDLAWRPREGGPLRRRLRRAVERSRGLDRWLALILAEYGWRLFNPKIRALLITAVVSALLLGGLVMAGAWGLIPSTGAGAGSTGFILTSGLGVLLAGLTSVSALWGLGALFTESIVPGTDSLAERLSLGNGDPFARFRRHFADTLARVRRPVMVVVDDLDRCKPEFVVDLVRGIQTLLRSPRVVFVILGDRDWIERAFEAHHQAMSKVDVGPEQSFGARFVEKAIQMSFILPGLGAERRRLYVKRILGGARPGAPAAAQALPRDARVELRQLAQKEIAARAADEGNTAFPSAAPIVSAAMAALDTILPAAAAAAPVTETARRQTEREVQEQVEQIVNEELAISAVVDARVEAGITHQLEALAPFFPANPRQIKRIVNAFTIYYAVALQREDVTPDRAFRFQLALWVIVMTEWPKTWRLLASFPDLVTILTAEPATALGRDDLTLPGTPAATQKAVAAILADPELKALITGRSDAGAHDPLDVAAVRILAELTPLHSRRRRLAEEEAKPASAPAPAA